SEQHHGDDAAAAGDAEDGDAIRGFQEGGRHARQGAFAGSDEIGRRADQAIQVRFVDGGGEVVHLIVEQHAAVTGDEGGAKQIVDGEGAGDPVALAVENGEVAGVAAAVIGG